MLYSAVSQSIKMYYSKSDTLQVVHTSGSYFPAQTQQCMRNLEKWQRSTIDVSEEGNNLYQRDKKSLQYSSRVTKTSKKEGYTKTVRDTYRKGTNFMNEKV